MALTTTRHCEARISWRPGAYRLEPVTCGQVVAVTTVIDATGTVRGACPREGHREQVVRRFGTYPGDLAANELAALDRHAETAVGCGCDEDRWCDDHRPCCGAGGSTPHWVGCPEFPENVNRALAGDR